MERMKQMIADQNERSVTFTFRSAEICQIRKIRVPSSLYAKNTFSADFLSSHSLSPAESPSSRSRISSIEDW